jgi:hypothetical protein
MANMFREVTDWDTQMEETGVRLRYWWPGKLASYTDKQLGRLWEAFYFSDADGPEKVPTAPDVRFLRWLNRYGPSLRQQLDGQ